MSTIAIIYNIALFLLVGHILNCGRSIHSSGIRDGIVRSINVIRVFVYCHILRPSPHSVNWIRTHNPSRRAPVDLRLSPRGHWDRHEGKSEDTIVTVHCVKAYVRVEACAYLLYGTKSRVVTDLLTGHNTLIRQLLLMGLTNSPLCRRRGEEDELQPIFCVSVKL